MFGIVVVVDRTMATVIEYTYCNNPGRIAVWMITNETLEMMTMRTFWGATGFDPWGKCTDPIAEINVDCHVLVMSASTPYCQRWYYYLEWRSKSYQ